MHATGAVAAAPSTTAASSTGNASQNKIIRTSWNHRQPAAAAAAGSSVAWHGLRRIGSRVTPSAARSGSLNVGVGVGSEVGTGKFTRHNRLTNHQTTRILNPGFLSYVASYDVASDIYQGPTFRRCCSRSLARAWFARGAHPALRRRMRCTRSVPPPPRGFPLGAPWSPPLPQVPLTARLLPATTATTPRPTPIIMPVPVRAQASVPASGPVLPVLVPASVPARTLSGA